MPRTNEDVSKMNNSILTNTPDCESVIKLSKATLEDIEFLRANNGEDYRGVMDGLNRLIRYLIDNTYQLDNENVNNLNEALEFLRIVTWAGDFITNLSKEE